MIANRWRRSVCLAILIIGGGAAARDVGQAQSHDAQLPITTRFVSLDEMVDLEETFTTLAERVSPSVVAIRVTRTLGSAHAADEGNHPGDDGDVTINQAPDQPIASAGSGIILRENGCILTNEHVIAAADQITVLLHDGSRFPARLVASDPRSDLAVIKIDREGLKPARLSDLSQVQRGQWAFAMGDPYGFAGDGQLAISVGHISALDRALQKQLDPTNVRYYGNLIQTTAEINPGNSGGPLLNLRGEVMGINTAIQTRSGNSEGVGFAVPISERTKRIIEQLLRGERTRYGYLGVHVRRPTSTERKEAGAPSVGGAMITAVEPGTPAEAADLQVGDIICEYDGIGVESADHLVRRVGMTSTGAEVTIRYFRSGVKRTAAAVITRRYVPGQDGESQVQAHRVAPGQGSA